MSTASPTSASKYPFFVAFLIGIGIVIILGIPHVLILKKNMNSLFMDLDVIN